ncbi:MAG TPA: putative quinol monooxygenase [Longimicrobium sp.]|nr:putative quinol monooxygenase [Longimicrobium sp.]
MRFGLFAKLVARPGQSDAVAALLLRGVEEIREIGCELYVVNTSPDHPDAIYVMEVWTSKEAHHGSLQLPAVKEAIAQAMPLLTGEFESTRLDVAGGLGLSIQPA